MFEDNLTIKLKTENNKIFENICSIDNKTNDGVCLPNYIIQKINTYTDKNKTGCNNIECVELNKTDIIKNITSELGCEDDKNRDLCILKKSNEKKYIDDNETKLISFSNFKPFASLNPRDWLSNEDIDTIQEQLFKKYDDYYYSYIHMIDLVMINHSNDKFVNHKILNVKEIDFVKEILNEDHNNKISIDTKPFKSYGIVCNTDPSTLGGQHWFSIYFNFKTLGTLKEPYTIEYFNSSGEAITNKNFSKFFIDLALHISRKLQKCCNFIQVTNIQHQGTDPGLGEESGNCSVYALYYLWSRIEGVPYQYFNEEKKPLTDSIMTKFRGSLFRSK